MQAGPARRQGGPALGGGGARGPPCPPLGRARRRAGPFCLLLERGKIYLFSQSPPGASRAPLTPASAGFGPRGGRTGAIADRISRGRGIATWGATALQDDQEEGGTTLSPARPSWDSSGKRGGSPDPAAAPGPPSTQRRRRRPPGRAHPGPATPRSRHMVLRRRRRSPTQTPPPTVTADADDISPCPIPTPIENPQQAKPVAAAASAALATLTAAAGAAHAAAPYEVAQVAAASDNRLSTIALLFGEQRREEKGGEEGGQGTVWPRPTPLVSGPAPAAAAAAALARPPPPALAPPFARERLK